MQSALVEMSHSSVYTPRMRGTAEDWQALSLMHGCRNYHKCDYDEALHDSVLVQLIPLRLVALIARASISSFKIQLTNQSRSYLFSRTISLPVSLRRMGYPG